MKMKTKPKKTEVVTFRIDVAIMRKIRISAVNNDRTYGKEINHVLREALNK